MHSFVTSKNCKVASFNLGYPVDGNQRLDSVTDYRQVVSVSVSKQCSPLHSVRTVDRKTDNRLTGRQEVVGLVAIDRSRVRLPVSALLRISLGEVVKAVKATTGCERDVVHRV